MHDVLLTLLRTKLLCNSCYLTYSGLGPSASPETPKQRQHKNQNKNDCSCSC